jgi:hypothetical protein
MTGILKYGVGKGLLVVILMALCMPAQSEMVDDEALLRLSRDWEYAGIYSLAFDGEYELRCRLKGEELRTKIPVGRSGYDSFFENPPERSTKLVFVYIVYRDDRQDIDDPIRSHKTASKLVTFGVENEKLKEKPMRLALLVRRGRISEKREFSLDQLERVLHCR